MSGIQDMNNRMKQNRNLKPSKRSKFIENNRGTIFVGTNKEDKPDFKEFSEFQVKKTISKIRTEAKSKKRRDLIILVFFIILFATFVFYSLMPSREVQINQIVEKDKPKELIMWNGKRTEPIKIPFSDFLYVPIIGDLNDEMDLQRTYEIKTSNLTVEYTSNIIFFDKDSTELRKLLSENGSVNMMFVGPGKSDFESNKIIYVIAESDTNKDGKVDFGDNHYLYFSELDGTGLTRITERNPKGIGWTSEGEIFFRI